MPRKRKTRTTQSRPTPKVPEGDEGSNLDRDLKKEKLRTLLDDFDTEMANFFQKMRVDLKDLEKSVELSFRVEIAKIPQFIRDMDLDEYLKAGGTLTSEVTQDKFSQDFTDTLETDMTLATLTKSKKKKKKLLKPINEEDTGTIKKGTRGRKRGVGVSVDAASTIVAAPGTARTRRTARQKFETPFQKAGGPGAYGWETPLITPKFDPRLPVTPAMSRQPKFGEVCLSLAGSPLMNKQDKDVLRIRKSDQSKKTRIVVADKELDMESITVPDMSQMTMDYLRILRDKLNEIPLTPK